MGIVAGRRYGQGFALRFLISSVTGALLLGASDGSASPWPGFGRTTPVSRYEQDAESQSGYQFGIRKTFPPYVDPDLREAYGLPDPTEDDRFDSYDLFVVVNKEDSRKWGRGQTLRVYERGFGLRYYWLISTGRRGFDTPSGFYRVQGFSSRHWSNSYDVPMFFSVFFNGGIALHSSIDSYSLKKLGEPLSHGCVHIEDYRSRELFHLIGQSDYGSVVDLDRKTGNPRRVGGQTNWVNGYRTLIIVTPI